ncbi:MAG: TRZ/ATZ family hydrolase [Betaproteobacteria bacterium]|nr:TRZ/ATZ family hydrolase [Betaproteobacteria bacterium]
MEHVECIIDARWVVPVEPSRAVLSGYSVAIHHGKIVALLPHHEAATRFSSERHIGLPRHVLIPGLVNSHTHASMSLMRGLADDLPLMTWLEDHIWPAERAFVSPEFVYDGTALACAEMLRGGITCFNEMYFFPESAARAAISSGLRASIGLIAIDFPTQYASDPDDYLSKGLALRDKLRNDPKISFCMAPHAPYTVGDATLLRIVTMAEELDLPIHIHLHETRHEIEQSISRYKMRPLERLRALGMVGPRLIAVHAVHLLPAEIAELARFGCSVAHCPSSNLKLASGFAPVAAMLEHGVNVCFGTDGAASNNRLDIFQEMRLAALLAKGVSGDAQAMPATDALHAATLGGARALGLGDSIGSLLPGKEADLCAVLLDGPGLTPCYDVVSHLVYAAGRENVSHVWVGGELLLEEGRPTRPDTRDLDKLGFLWQNKLAETKA